MADPEPPNWEILGISTKIELAHAVQVSMKKGYNAAAAEMSNGEEEDLLLFSHFYKSQRFSSVLIDE